MFKFRNLLFIKQTHIYWGYILFLNLRTTLIQHSNYTWNFPTFSEESAKKPMKNINCVLGQ